jgi:tRNA(adenine34) deaminase
MEQALGEARKASAAGEVPVGAVLLDSSDNLIAKGHNAPIARLDPTAHAEIVVLRAAAQILENYRLGGTTLYVSLEPCVMCAGAIVHARVSRVVFGAFDPKFGGCGSAVHALQYPGVTHYLELRTGLMAEESAGVLKAFFKARR